MVQDSRKCGMKEKQNLKTLNVQTLDHSCPMS
jgi:hypothetical protein